MDQIEFYSPFETIPYFIANVAPFLVLVFLYCLPRIIKEQFKDGTYLKRVVMVVIGLFIADGLLKMMPISI